MKSLSCLLVLVAIVGDIVAEKVLTIQPHNAKDICNAHETWTFVQDAEDCRRFYVCAYNKIEEFNCADNYHFSVKDMRCVLGSCEAQKEQEGEQHTEEEKEKPNVEEAEGEEQDIDDIEDGDDESEEDQFEANTSTTNLKCKLHTIKRVETDCTIYQQCASGVFVNKRCANGTYFDMAFRSCLPIDISPRHQCSCVLPDNATLSNPRDCETYYRCEHGIAVLQQCPRDQYFEASVSSCLPDLTGICLEHPTMPPNLDNSVAYAEEECKKGRYITASHVANCAKFFLCGRKGVREMSCPLGQYYDPLSRFCRKDVRNMCTDHKLETFGKEEQVEEEKKTIIKEFVKDLPEKVEDNNEIIEETVNEQPETVDEDNYEIVEETIKEQPVQVEEEKNAIIEEFVKDKTEEVASHFNKFSSKFSPM